jgi:integrase
MVACSIWLESFKSQSTKKSYKIHLLMFCKYHNTDPDSLIQLKADQIKNMVIEYIVQLKKVAKQYVSKAKRGEICVNSIKTYMMGIQSFLEFHELALPWKKISRFYPPEIANNLRAYTKEEIIKILSVADLRDRSIILLMISTGIRVGAIKSLKLKHLKKLKEEIGILTVYAESKNDRYNALITPECIAAIDDYSQYRKKQCEKITDDSYIIRDKFATFSKKTNRAKPLSENTINKQMKHLLRKAGLSYEELQPDHSLRRFFNTALMNSDVTYSFKELMMGHSLKLDNVYYPSVCILCLIGILLFLIVALCATRASLQRIVMIAKVYLRSSMCQHNLRKISNFDSLLLTFIDINYRSYFNYDSRKNINTTTDE